MLLPTIRQIEAFVLIYNLRSVTRAAGRMELTQSAVSVLLRQFEEFIGTQLFDRSTRSLTPTQAAVALLTPAERALREAGSLRRIADRLRDEMSGRVRFAATASLTATSLPRIMTAFHARHPEIELNLYDISHQQMLRGLLEDEVDFSIGGKPPAEVPELQYELMLRDPVVAIRRRSGTGEAAPERLPWSTLVEEPTLISVQRGSGLRELIDRSLAPHGIAFEPSFEFRLGTTAITMVMEGLGTGVLPKRLIPVHYLDALVIQPLIEPVITREIVAVTRRTATLPPATILFLKELREELAIEEDGVGPSA